MSQFPFLCNHRAATLALLTLGAASASQAYDLQVEVFSIAPINISEYTMSPSGFALAAPATIYGRVTNNTGFDLVNSGGGQAGGSHEGGTNPPAFIDFLLGTDEIPSSLQNGQTFEGVLGQVQLGWYSYGPAPTGTEGYWSGGAGVRYWRADQVGTGDPYFAVANLGYRVLAQPVPEPALLAAVGLGLAALARRRKAVRS